MICNWNSNPLNQNHEIPNRRWAAKSWRFLPARISGSSSSRSSCSRRFRLLVFAWPIHRQRDRILQEYDRILGTFISLRKLSSRDSNYSRNAGWSESTIWTIQEGDSTGSVGDAFTSCEFLHHHQPSPLVIFTGRTNVFLILNLKSNDSIPTSTRFWYCGDTN